MLFGEIVEPSTRALIDEDLDEYPETTESEPVWEGIAEAPKEIDTLIFIETDKVRKLFHSCVLEEQRAISKIRNGGIEVFNIGTKQFLVVLTEKKDLTMGEITESFDRWISVAKNIFAITSDTISNYQNRNIVERPVSLVKVLSNDPLKPLGYDNLESPNLVSGLGASILSYCIYRGLKCTLFIAYIDTSPLDSMNMGPLLRLFENIGITVKNTELKLSTSSSNLYM